MPCGNIFNENVANRLFKPFSKNSSRFFLQNIVESNFFA
ncbi:hypothetical protein CFter6_2930 [Collimonas fungivorans]|uniref:Uncharacterized protein n=1 Tax=Collimonas fungivorans TaxID=158899 RepID=A0A127PCP5_9BURK|nr:hypothetical protein CFter6_2930 [Collimonas fungivorans]